ncbi:hypothetical protein [Microbacterium sp. GXF7504]
MTGHGHSRKGQAVRTDLLDRVVKHIGMYGTVGLNLTGLARSIGSNNRMLLYYFGSFDALVAEASFRFHDQYIGMSRIGDASGRAGERLKQVWRRIASPEARASVTLFFEEFGLGVGGLRRDDVHREIRTWWREQVEAAIADEVAGDVRASAAEAIVATWRGLQLALLAGAPVEALDAANDLAVDAILASARQGAP